MRNGRISSLIALLLRHGPSLCPVTYEQSRNTPFLDARQNRRMLEPSARLLRLLALLQSRRDWTSAEIATRLDVTTRTVRNDVDRLRRLGYPVEARPGVAGGYRLGTGGALPPLL